MIQYKGARWYKCDFHLHTPASLCFKDQTVTPEQWVNRVKELHLDCVAITDHNTGDWIDRVKAAAKIEDITVFPGVEITCDTSKIHLLVIFDTNKNTQYVNDFLISCGISRDDFAKPEAHSFKTVMEIAEMANKIDAIVIPAHIDEFNGLGTLASKNVIEDLFNLDYINAVQFVHKEYLQSNINVVDDDELKKSINRYYNNPRVEISVDAIKKGYDSIAIAKQKKISLLTFSDNPDLEIPSKHGLSGIGKTYTWIKMDEKPDIEGVRQAFIFSDRTANSFEHENCPYEKPNLWIKSIAIQNTTITKNENVVTIDFCPSLTTIIGGRGSGKSSILRFLRGVFDRNADIKGLDEILSEQQQFFKKHDSEGIGVLKSDSKIVVEFVRDGILYRISYAESTGERRIERYNVETRVFDIITDEFFIDFFDFEQYSQKQIFALAQKPNELRNRIDAAIHKITEIQDDRRQIESDFNQKIATRNALVQSTMIKSKLTTEIRDLESKIQLLQQSGISELLKDNQFLLGQFNGIKIFFQKIREFQSELAKSIELYNNLPTIEEVHINEPYNNVINSLLENLLYKICDQKQTQQYILSAIENEIANVKKSICNSGFWSDLLENKQQFNAKKKELESRGVTDLSDFKKYNTTIEQKRKELEIISQNEVELANVNKQVNDLLAQSLEKRKLITTERINFINLFNSEKIKVKIRIFGDKKEFIYRLRQILQRQTGFDNAIEILVQKIFGSQTIEENLKATKAIIKEIYMGSYNGDEFDVRFVNLIKGLTQEQMNNIVLLYPEDEIEMTYRNSTGNFRPLSVASAGQKTTAILTFILSFGTAPLVLDQPEDDLDNHLVYSLIVDKIKEIKQKRQVIVVTHNANIPVNGDAEYVISMSSETHNLKIQAEGTIEKRSVKQEICDVMEGGIDAFKTRARKYKL